MRLKGVLTRPISYAIVAMLIVAVPTAAHLHVMQRGGDYTGLLLVLDHAFTIAAVLLLLSLCFALGRSVLHVLGALPKRPIDSLVFSAAVGVGLIATLLLAVGLLGGLQRVTIGILLLAIGGASWAGFAKIPESLSAVAASLKVESEDKSFFMFGVGLLVLAAAVMLLFAVAPPVDWDGLMYHLQIPSQYLDMGRIYLPDDNLHESHIGLIHMLYIPLLAIGSDAGPATLNVGLAALLALATYSMCARYLSAKTGCLVLALLWGTTTILLVAITPRVDVAVTLLVFLANYALLSDVLDEVADNKQYYLAAAILGMAIGTKLSAIPYVLALAPLVIWAAAKRTGSFSGTVRVAFAFGACLALVTMPWLLKNWILLGAPLYPFFAESLVPGWLTSLFGVTSWPSSVDPRLMEFIWELRAPFNLADAFFAPGRLSIEVEGAHYYLNPILLALPLWLFFVRERVLNWLVVPAMAYLVIVLSVLPSPNLRYLLPAIPALTIAVAHMAVTLSERFLSPAFGRALLISVSILVLAPSTTAVQHRFSRSQALYHFMGQSSADDYMASRIGPAYVDMVNLAEREVGAEGRILMLWDARGYYFEPRVIQDNLSVNWPLLASTLSEDDCLGETGISHVLLGIGSFRYYVVAGGLDPERLSWSEFQQFAANCLELVRDDRAMVLFRVKRAENEEARPGPAERENSEQSGG
jgi:hypothetical protein